MNANTPSGAAELSGLDASRTAPGSKPASNEKNDGGSRRHGRPPGSYCNAFVITLAALGSGQTARAADPSPPPESAQSGDAAQNVANYFADWSDRVKATQADQPSWAAPLNTVTPLLKEFAQYSQGFQALPNGANTILYDGGSGGVGLVWGSFRQVKSQGITRPLFLTKAVGAFSVTRRARGLR